MNIFIAGLNYNMSEAELGELFAEYGEVVSVKIIMDRETGRSKGYGFVEMADDEAGDKAIAALNEVDMDGKTLSVSVARPLKYVRSAWCVAKGHDGTTRDTHPDKYGCHRKGGRVNRDIGL